MEMFPYNENNLNENLKDYEDMQQENAVDENAPEINDVSEETVAPAEEDIQYDLMFNETTSDDKPEETEEVVINDEGLAAEEAQADDTQLDNAATYVESEETKAVDEQVEEAVVENIEDPAVEEENPAEEQYQPLLGYDKDGENPARLAEEDSYGENTQDEIAEEMELEKEEELINEEMAQNSEFPKNETSEYAAVDAYNNVDNYEEKDEGDYSDVTGNNDVIEG